MTIEERLDKLYAEAKKLGMDHPSENLIRDAMYACEFDAFMNPKEAAERHNCVVTFEEYEVWP